MGVVGIGTASIVVAAVIVATPKVDVFGENGFFTIWPQNRDLAALLPGKDSYGRPTSFLVSFPKQRLR